MRAPVCAIARRAAKAAPARPRKVERLRLMSAQRKLEALSDGARLGGLREAHQHGAMNRLDRSSTNDRLGGRPRRAAHGRAEGGTGYKHAAAGQRAEYHRSRKPSVVSDVVHPGACLVRSGPGGEWHELHVPNVAKSRA